MARDNYYKLYQLSNVLITKYDFKQVIIQEYRHFSNDEAWFINTKDTNYNLIRISFNSAYNFEYDSQRINEYISFFNNTYKVEAKFLDIHICKEEYDKTLEYYDYLNIENEFNSGKDVSNIYPEIYQVIHDVENQEKEILNLVKHMHEVIGQKRKQFLKNHRPVLNNSIIIICIALHFIRSIIEYIHSGSSLILMGANYTTFTLGLKQYYRLITSGFLHVDFLHLVVNMYSLNYLGRYIEITYGKVKYILILLSAILIGNLCFNIISYNTICAGLSGGLYAFLVIYIIDALKENRTNLYNILPMIFINLFINFLPNIAWVAHLGGAVAGYLWYLIIYEQDNRKNIALLVIVIVVLFIKFLSINTIDPLYAITDNDVIEAYYKIGFKKYALRLLERLTDVYTKYGG